MLNLQALTNRQSVYTKLAAKHWSQITIHKAVNCVCVIKNATLELVEGSGPVIAAKNIRKELKSAFPGIKFSVVSERYSMGNSININWTDGPSKKAVEAISNKYSAGYFDGMTDCYEYTQATRKYGSSKHIFTNRELTPELVERAIDAVSSRVSNPRPETKAYLNGRLYDQDPWAYRAIDAEIERLSA